MIGQWKERSLLVIIICIVEVSFTARLVTLLETQSGDVIKFSAVLHNTGSGYSASTGVFTAPSNGTYEFILITANELENAQMRTDLMRGRSATSAKHFVYFSCYRPRTKLRKDNVFTSVCQEFCPRGRCTHTLPADPLPARHRPLARQHTTPTPLARHHNPPSPARNPHGQRPLSADGYCNGRYASY